MGAALIRHAASYRSFAALALIAACAFASGIAHADDWGCQVILCLSNPGGPEQYSECVPPIERLWRALRHGDPFPTCNFGAGSSQGTFATNTFASSGYCREDLLYWGEAEQSELRCDASGAINVDIDDQLYTRVWWGVRGQVPTITEFYGTGSAQVSYNPTKSAALFLQQAEQQENGFGGRH
ncbi:hypothetical protein R75465_06023 [Paraburkholderia aspalathi]|uniref:hypothetical protein n=1 Tax=Paraburkholderia aspalathi TaxID=1324617 RepID=UPI001B192549|nr:hypothetical protein [Paraburkholderia aspalathi]CAE6825292.1 hypothetical protein R75465_06023 [Paraburkholderia aspalathi]